PSVVGNPASATLSWTVRNQGPVATAVNQWTDRVVLSRDAVLGNADDVRLSDVTHTGPVVPNATYNQVATVTLPSRTEGAFFLFLTTDQQNQVIEGDESNNPSGATPIQVVRQQPDLVVTAIDVPSTQIVGNPPAAQVSWTVKNQGSIPTPVTQWADAVV